MLKPHIKIHGAFINLVHILKFKFLEETSTALETEIHSSQVVVAQDFNPSTPEAEASESL